MSKCLERIIDALNKKAKLPVRKNRLKQSEIIRAFMHPNPSERHKRRSLEEYCQLYHKCSVEKFMAL